LIVYQCVCKSSVAPEKNIFGISDWVRVAAVECGSCLQAAKFEAALKKRFTAISPKPCWYPGSREVYERFVDTHENVELISAAGSDGRFGVPAAIVALWPVSCTLNLVHAALYLTIAGHAQADP
jgi:hypothetical protein